MAIKIGFYTNKADYVEWLNRQVELIRTKALPMAKREYELALAGVGKEAWMSMNNITDEAEWQKHIEWRKDCVAYEERRIRKYQREIAKNS